MTKDALDNEIEAKRREREEARTRLAALEVELRTLERAASLRPIKVAHRQMPSADIEQRSDSRKGRQLGAISKDWQKILALIATHYPEGATPEEIASFGPGIGLANLRPTDARQRAEKYIILGYFEANGNRYKVTLTARERFRIGAPNADTPTLFRNDSEKSGYVEVP
jgi:hypothetical protein